MDFKICIKKRGSYTRMLMLSIVCMLMSCQEEFNKHFEPTGSATIAENIVEVLESYPEFSLFVEAIHHLDLGGTLGKSAMYTCFAPTNKHVESYLTSIGFPSIKDVPEQQLTKWVNYHFVMGMYYRYDIEKKVGDVADQESLSFFRSNTDLTTRDDSKNPGKQIRLYTPTWSAGRASDYKFLKNEDVDPTSFSVEGVALSERYDIGAANGVIHVLSAPLALLPRADEAIAQDTSLSIIKGWMDRYIAYSIVGEDEYGKIDTTSIKSYTFGADIAKETSKYTFIASTNNAIRKFFAPYLENFNNDYDSIPQAMILDMLKTSFVSNYWGMSDITRGDTPGNYIRAINNAYIRKGNDVEPYYTGGISASNAMIYKVDEMIKIPELTSVEGGVMMNALKYKEWGKMVNNGRVGGLTGGLLYEHPVRTILIQNDNIWTKFVEDFSTDKKPDANGFSELDSLGWSLNTGVILENIQDGKFEEKKYYLTNYGSIFYEDGTFTDYIGKTVSLVSKKSTWDANNGSIYEVDGFLNPLIISDTTQTVYSKIESDTSYSMFKLACDLTGVSEQLKQLGYFQYTAFAVSNQSEGGRELTSLFGNSEGGDAEVDYEGLQEFVERHIVQRKIFTDGGYEGIIVNLFGKPLRIGGKWETFTVAGETGVSVPVVLEHSNVQGNNGVIHRVEKLLK